MSAPRRVRPQPRPRPRPSVASAALIVALGLILLPACGDGGSGSPVGDSTPASGTPATVATEAPLLPTTTDALPEMDAVAYDELLTQLRGTPVIVNFWAAWCPPCREEAPMLAAAGRDHGEEIQFLGVDILDERGAATDFIEEFSIPYPNVFDPPGEIRTAVGSIGQPVTVFYDADGAVVDKVDGQLSQKDLDRNIDLLLGD